MEQAEKTMLKSTLSGVVDILKAAMAVLTAVGFFVKLVWPKFSTVVDKVQHAIDSLQSIINGM